MPVLTATALLMRFRKMCEYWCGRVQTPGVMSMFKSLVHIVITCRRCSGIDWPQVTVKMSTLARYWHDTGVTNTWIDAVYDMKQSQLAPWILFRGDSS